MIGGIAAAWTEWSDIDGQDGHIFICYNDAKALWTILRPSFLPSLCLMYVLVVVYYSLSDHF